AQGGQYTIDIAGNVTYKPPSPGFVGQDTVVYTMKQTGTTLIAGANIIINVGTVPSNVYAKIVKRNIVTTSSNESGEIWIDFYSDPAGTIPYDVTALGLTINVEERRR